MEILIKGFRVLTIFLKYKVKLNNIFDIVLDFLKKCRQKSEETI
jgi:hypothetical protein